MAELEIRVTLETLFELLRVERKRKELQHLPVGFLNDVAKYVSHKKAMAAADEGSKNQLAQVYRILQDLFGVREHKLIELARLRASTGSAVSESMLPRELEFCEQMIAQIRAFRQKLSFKDINIPAMNVKETELGPMASNNVKVKITSPLPKFMGKNKEVFGPYQNGEEVELPEELADIIIKRGRGRLI